MSWHCSTVQTCLPTDLLDCEKTRGKTLGHCSATVILQYNYSNSNNSYIIHEAEDCTHDMTVFVDTIYSTSLVQGFTKLNH